MPVAFLDSRVDNDFVNHCAAVSGNSRYRLIGVDQEFLGAAGLIIDRILATRLSSAAHRTILSLREEERAAAAAARRTGDPSALLLSAITDQRIAEVERALAKGGSPTSRKLFAALVDSHRIYRKNYAGAWDANLVSSQLMKRQYLAAAPASGKLLLKFGDYHL